MSSDGFTTVPTLIPPDLRNLLIETIFTDDGPGKRCLLDIPCVATLAMRLREELASSGLLPAAAVAIQAIAFDKSPAANWKVSWHQDLMYPFAAKVSAPGYANPTVKDGVHYARPPREVLDDLTAVRFHLDDCDESNGPLRLSPRSHKKGILATSVITACREKLGEVVCLASAGDALLMKPLVLHASSQALKPAHRRVIHIVYHSGAPTLESWHRTI